MKNRWLLKLAIANTLCWFAFREGRAGDKVVHVLGGGWHTGTSETRHNSFALQIELRTKAQMNGPFFVKTTAVFSW